MCCGNKGNGSNSYGNMCDDTHGIDLLCHSVPEGSTFLGGSARYAHSILRIPSFNSGDYRCPSGFSRSNLSSPTTTRPRILATKQVLLPIGGWKKLQRNVNLQRHGGRRIECQSGISYGESPRHDGTTRPIDCNSGYQRRGI